MEFLVEGALRRIEITTLIIAGWTGRDKATVEHHITELAAIGVKRPRSIPCFYRLGANFLPTAPGADGFGAGPIGGGGLVVFSRIRQNGLGAPSEPAAREGVHASGPRPHPSGP